MCAEDGAPPALADRDEVARGTAAYHLAAGALLPFLLERLGVAPASASAPFVATLVDVTGLVIHFS